MVSFERLREIHPDGDEELQRMGAGKIVRVRPTGRRFRHHGHCGRSAMLEIHPDDLELVGNPLTFNRYCCENQILLD